MYKKIYICGLSVETTQHLRQPNGPSIKTMGKTTKEWIKDEIEAKFGHKMFCKCEGMV